MKQENFDRDFETSGMSFTESGYFKPEKESRQDFETNELKSREMIQELNKGLIVTVVLVVLYSAILFALGIYLIMKSWN